LKNNIRTERQQHQQQRGQKINTRMNIQIDTSQNNENSELQITHTLPIRSTSPESIVSVSSVSDIFIKESKKVNMHLKKNFQLLLTNNLMV
jgi:hypothetical protein